MIDWINIECPLFKNNVRVNCIFLNLCSTFKSNISNPQYLCFPYRSYIGQLRLSPFDAITNGWISLWMESICLSVRKEAKRGYESLGFMEHR